MSRLKNIVAVATVLRDQQVVADFTDEQRQVLKTRVLPELQAVIPDVSGGAAQWLKAGALAPNGRIVMPDAAYSRINKLRWYWVKVYGIINAVVAPGSAAKRAKILKASTSLMFRGDDVPIETLMSNTIKGTRKLLTSPDAKWLTPEAQAALEQAADAQTFSLLQKSWTYIVDEVAKEFKSLVKKNKLKMIPEGKVSDKTSKALAEHALTLLKSMGFKPSTLLKDTRHSAPSDLIKYLSKDGIGIGVTPNGLYPVSEIEGRARDNARYGVDTGISYWTSFGAGRSVESMVEEAIETEQARRERLLSIQGLELFKLAPQLALRLSEERKAQVKEALLSKGKWSWTPSGFGTGYVFNTKGAGDKASPELTKLVGKTVFFTTFDAD